MNNEMGGSCVCMCVRALGFLCHFSRQGHTFRSGHTLPAAAILDCRSSLLCTSAAWGNIFFPLTYKMPFFKALLKHLPLYLSWAVDAIRELQSPLPLLYRVLPCIHVHTKVKQHKTLLYLLHQNCHLDFRAPHNSCFCEGLSYRKDIMTRGWVHDKIHFWVNYPYVQPVLLFIKSEVWLPTVLASYYCARTLENGLLHS